MCECQCTIVYALTNQVLQGGYLKARSVGRQTAIKDISHRRIFPRWTDCRAMAVTVVIVYYLGFEVNSLGYWSQRFCLEWISHLLATLRELSVRGEFSFKQFYARRARTPIVPGILCFLVLVYVQNLRGYSGIRG